MAIVGTVALGMDADSESISIGSAEREGALHALGFASLLAAGGLLAATSMALPVICPLRAFTGVPCPFCGMTTGTVAMMRGDLGGALAANPFSPLVLFAILGGFVDGVRRFFGRAAIWARFPTSSTARRRVVSVLIGAGAVSWVIQLNRFGFI